MKRKRPALRRIAMDGGGFALDAAAFRGPVAELFLFGHIRSIAGFAARLTPRLSAAACRTAASDQARIWAPSSKRAAARRRSQVFDERTAS